MTRTAHPNNAWRRLGAAVLLSCALIASTAEAKETTAPSSAPVVLTLEEAAQLLRIRSDELERLALRNKVPARRIGSRWRFNQAALLAWLNGDWKLITTAVPPDAVALAPLDMGRVTGTGTSVAQSQSEPAGEDSASGGKSQDPIGEAPEERTAEEVFLRAQKVLLAPGEATVDFGQFFSRSDNQ